MVKNDKRKFDDIDANNVIMTRSKTRSLKQSTKHSKIISPTNQKKITSISQSSNCFKRRKLNNLETMQKH